MRSDTFAPSSKVLNSWKQIGQYLNRGVRTVQRWEAELSLPVRRPRGKNRSAVIALPSELDLWAKSRPLKQEQKFSQRQAPQSTCLPVNVSTRELVLASRRLHDSVMQSRLDLSASIAKLVVSLKSMSVSE